MHGNQLRIHRSYGQSKSSRILPCSTVTLVKCTSRSSKKQLNLCSSRVDVKVDSTYNGVAFFGIKEEKPGDCNEAIASSDNNDDAGTFIVSKD